MKTKLHEPGKIKTLVLPGSLKCSAINKKRQQIHPTDVKAKHGAKPSTGTPLYRQKYSACVHPLMKDHANMFVRLHHIGLPHLYTHEKTYVVCLRGTVPAVDQEKMTFQIQQAHGTKITCPMRKQLQEIVIKAFNGYRAGTKIRIRGVSTYRQNDHTTSMKLIDDVCLLNPLDVPARLDEFRDMQDGWLEGGGCAPSHVGIDWLADVFQKFYPDTIPLPHTYPTYDGCIRMEWSHKNNNSILEIDLQNRKGKYLFFDEFSDNEFERVLDLSSPNNWQWLISEIQNKIA